MIKLSDHKFRIEIADQQTYPIDPDQLVAAVAMILDDYGFESAEISIAIVDDVTIRQYNQQYLQHDYETDVLSFLLDCSEDHLVGQLIVSTDTAERVAKELGSSFADEMLLYVVHGSLHLMGLDDTTPECANEMRDAEKLYLAKMGVAYHWAELDK